MGTHLQKILQVNTGDEVIFIGQGADGSIANDLFTIVGIAGKDSEDSDASKIYMTLADAQEFLSLGNRIHEVSIRLANYKAARAQAELLQNRLNYDHLDVQPWQGCGRAVL